MTSRRSSGSMRAESAVEPTRSENITVTWRRSAVSLGFELSQRRLRRCLDGTYKLRDRRQHLSSMAEQDADLLKVLVGQVAKDRDIDFVLGKALGVLGHAELIEPLRNLLHCGASPRTLRCSGRRLSEPKALGHFGRGVLRLVMAAWLPPGCLCQPLFPRAAHRAGIVLKLAARDLPAARRGPRVRQDLRRLCGSPPRHKRASGLREPGTGPSILRRRDTHARQPTAQRRTRLRFAPVHGYWRSILRA